MASGGIESRSLLGEAIAPLIGSVCLHVAVVLASIAVARHAAKTIETDRDRPDAWVGNAVEVDAVATPEAPPSLPSEANEPTKPALEEHDSTAIAVPTTAPPTPPPAPKTAEPNVVAPPSPPKPRPPRVAKPRPSENSASASSASSAAANSSNSPPSSAASASGAFGGEGLPPGVRSLPSAFTRAIPPATGADSVWQSLPVGAQQPFTIAIEVDEEGRITSSEILKEKDGHEPEEQAEHVRHRVVALLGGGLFALQNNIGKGRALFRITITLSDRRMSAAADPAQLVERGFEPPDGATPGRAYFTLASGRHFEAKVQVLSRK